MTEINHFFPEKECRKKDVYTAGWQRQNQKNVAWFQVHISIFLMDTSLWDTFTLQCDLLR